MKMPEKAIIRARVLTVSRAYNNTRFSIILNFKQLLVNKYKNFRKYFDSIKNEQRAGGIHYHLKTSWDPLFYSK